MNSHYQTPIYDKRLGYVTPQRLETRAIRQDVNRMLLTLLAFFVAQTLVSMGIGFFALQGVNFAASPVTYYGVTALLTVLAFPVPFLLYLLARRLPLQQLLHFEKTKRSSSLMLVVAGIGACLVLNFPVEAIRSFMETIGLPEPQPQEPIATSLVAKIMVFLVTAIMPAVFEEFVFRGVILGTLAKYGEGFAVVFSAAIFGLLHLSVSGFVFAFICGLIMGYAYVRTKNLWVPVFIHLGNNGIAVIMELLYEQNQNWGAVVGNIVFYGLILAGGICAIVLVVKKYFHKPLGAPLQAELSHGQAFWASLTNPGFIMYVSICVFTILTTLLVL